MLRIVAVPVAAAALLLLLPACGPGGEEAAAVPDRGTVTVLNHEAVAGWLSVQTPGPVEGIEAVEGSAHVLSSSGLLLSWSRDSGTWNSRWIEGAEDAFSLTLLQGEPVLLTPEAVVLVGEDTAEKHRFQVTSRPLEAASEGDELVVLFNDGSLLQNPHTSSSQTFSQTGPAPHGGLVRAGEDWAWINTDGTLTLLDTRVGLRRSENLPDGVTVLAWADDGLYAGDGTFVYHRTGPEEWSEHSGGTLHSSGLIMGVNGVAPLDGGASLAGEIPESPVQLMASGASPVWALTSSGLLVWAGLDQVETRLPAYDMARIQCSLAGQTGGQTAGSVSGVAPVSVSVSGVFRIYESVSSRPDPFTEFPVARRDLRRPLIELSIEELHLVGITLDPFGGDQAMVEDANGVAYILNEGTLLANNTRIAEITSNEVIVVQEVTVGSMMDDGVVTSIPTIYSMRLHEEGGF